MTHECEYANGRCVTCAGHDPAPPLPDLSGSAVTYDSVIAALEDGHGWAVNIAEYTGKHVSTVRKILCGYESEGVAGRWPGNGTAQMPDYWVIVPPEHRADARRRRGASDEDHRG